MICQKCKTKCDITMKFCPSCGLPLPYKKEYLRIFVFIMVVFFCVIGIFVNIFVSMLSDNSSTQANQKNIPASEQKVTKTEVQSKPVETKKPPTNYQGKRDEMLDALNGLENKNMYSNLYAGLSMQGNTITIQVSDQWSYMSKDAKIGFIKHIGTVWFGMAGARKIEVNPDDFKLKFVHNLSGRTLATWDSLWGPSIKD